MNDIEWRDGNLPVSKQFDDPYFSRHDGRAETEHVFINGNDLQNRWKHMELCTIAELGFGTGLNFLEIVRQWCEIRKPNARLDYFSFEQFPLPAEAIDKALGNWPDLEILKTRMLEVWRPDCERIETEFLPGVRLTVFMEDANKSLSSSSVMADAWFLDGFSPAKNPELWNEELMHAVAQHTVAGGTFSTYTAAGFVRRNLQAAGFEVHKVQGYGRKREMLTGKRPYDIDVALGH